MRHAICCLSGLLMSCTLMAGEPELTTDVKPGDPAIRYVGRFDTRDAKGPRCAWSACSAILRFEGSAVGVKLNEAGANRYQIVLDGKPLNELVPQKGEKLYVLAADLPAGEHRVEVFKKTEAFVGVTQFEGFALAAGGKTLPSIPAKRGIEVIGDSISCGYGNEGKSQNEHFKNETENAYLTYGALAARDLGADYVCVAWSGKKMWPDNTIPSLYDRALPDDAKSTWDFARFQPNAVLINLATNDFGKGAPDEKGWCDAYKTFVHRVRTNYPKAVIYCASSPMMNDSWPPEKKLKSVLETWLNIIVSDLAKEGDANVHFLSFAAQDMKDGLGADWHPNLKTNQIMAAKFVEELKKDLSW